MKKFQMLAFIAAMLALSAGAQSSPPTNQISPVLHQINPSPDATAVTALDTVKILAMYFTADECPDNYSRTIEMQSNVVKITYGQLATGCLDVPGGAVTDMFDVGRLLPGTYDLQVWIKRSGSNALNMVAATQLTIPALPPVLDDLPHDNFSGAWHSDSLSATSILTVQQNGFGLYASVFLYDKNNQPVWYVITPDTSGSDHPEIANANQRYFKNSWTRDHIYGPSSTPPANFVNQPVNGIQFKGLIYKLTGPSFVSGIVGAPAAELVGTTTLRFESYSHVTVDSMTIDGVTKRVGFYRN